ncbi:zinc-dependent alcohol dehydrogenase [Marinobacter goseongensis]|uniref:zinc-dependent alcohol dehydrogenase n=1 Tax=Marinobacter goseongensis TaxID=453838 RepID=UPI002003DE40|nr:zinc-binding alcohol dehydrogenase [Marinobacter goseongensis]MCK7549994.1 zinc-binding alcohol dehydrogenase [Marinobacter goseongensis]
MSRSDPEVSEACDESGVADDSATEAFWVTGAGRGAIRPTDVRTAAALTASEAAQSVVEVETLYSGVSRGTESLIFSGHVPPEEYQRMRAPFQEGEFPYPVKYGYCNVGKVTEGDKTLTGRTVFSLFPHQRRFRLPATAVMPLPDGVPPERAVLAANMETAINGLWDAAPRVGDRIAVVGLGVVGFLVAWLASRIPGTRVTAIDINPARSTVAGALGLAFETRAQRDDHDLVFHTSGHPDGLNTALSLAGMEGRIVEMSWFGTHEVSVALGGAFHSRRLAMISSQVGQISPIQRPRWTYPDRLKLALSLLDNATLDVLITGESRFEDLPQTMATLAATTDELCHRIRYN